MLNFVDKQLRKRHQSLSVDYPVIANVNVMFLFRLKFNFARIIIFLQANGDFMVTNVFLLQLYIMVHSVFPLGSLHTNALEIYQCSWYLMCGVLVSIIIAFY